MEDQELVQRLDEINGRLDELKELVERDSVKIESVFKFVGEFQPQLKVDVSRERKFGVTVGDRVAYGGRVGSVVGVGLSAVGRQAVIAFDDAKPNEPRRPQPVSTLIRLDEEVSGQLAGQPRVKTTFQSCSASSASL